VSSYPRPTELTLHVEREPVDGDCPSCGAADLRRYPVLSEGGWFQVVKCQACLTSVSREPWHRLGPLSLLVESL
jgi:vanillate/4-hydroxybenzoate decarboxylase subunit D